MEGNNLILDHAYHQAVRLLEKLQDQAHQNDYDRALMNLHLAKVELAIIEGQLIKKINFLDL